MLDLGLLALEDLDAFYFIPIHRYLFSTSTAVTLGGVIYGPGGIIEFDGASYSLFFDENEIVAAARDIDALRLLPNGNLLISTSTSAELYGFAFPDGDVVEVDTVDQVASLYQGLDEATLFTTGAHQDIDALHYDAATGAA